MSRRGRLAREPCHKFGRRLRSLREFCLEPIPRLPRWGSLGRAALQRRTDAVSSCGQQIKFLLTNSTAREMCQDQCTFGGADLSIQIGWQQGLDLFTVHSHISIRETEPLFDSCSSSTFRKVFNARSILDLTVPSGISRIWAISA